MKPEERKDFDQEAATWDDNPVRVKLAMDVADAIIREAAPTKDMDALDYGCGTGLVTLRLRPLVRSVTGADSSQKMLEVLQRKAEQLGLGGVRTQFVDFEQGGTVEGTYHLVVSSMTLHHVRDTALFFRQLRDLLAPGGVLALADLDKEDGSFHGDNRGIQHFGFERPAVKKLLTDEGFREVRDVTAATVVREPEGAAPREYPVFLMIARK